ncbi:hypothetical protein [Cupriavidus alkaliphilus]|uniref:hypothetical protein n=1 Tax=Cupriavidus alkaliphilus TaxID=942866 RepID=UPI00161F41AB|nr:hypothetical protein [Cupriavidus alkaliphilus]MBB3012032.1 hypothetical protein [Cupriavidus alkaliphilus]
MSSGRDSPVRYTAELARRLIATKFAAPEWATMFEVAPRTGGGTRYADAVAVNLWQSRGHAFHGFEIKVSRGDWLRELKDPAKAEEIQRFCDYWTIVAPKGVVADGELPPTWGLLEMRPDRLMQIKAGPKLDAQPITRAFFASLMRRGNEGLDQLSAKKLAAERAAMHTAIADQVEREVRNRTRDHERLKEQIAKFEQETGLSFSEWAGPDARTIKIAQALDDLSGWRDHSALSRLMDLAGELERAASTVRAAVGDTGLQEVKAA